MAFPQTPLPAEVWLAPGGDPVDPSARQWVDITDDVRARDGIQIEVGRADEIGQVDASKIGLTLDNRSGTYSPRNPLGPWYGQLRRNTPLQVTLPRVADAFTRTTSPGWGTTTSGHVWTQNNPPVWSTNGSQGIATPPSINIIYLSTITGAPDVEVRCAFTLASLPTGAAWGVGPVLRHTDGSNYYRIRVHVAPSGAVELVILRRSADVETTLASASAGTYGAGQKWWITARAEGPYLMAKVWRDGTTEPAWQAVARDGVLAGTNVGVHAVRAAGSTGPASIAVDDFSTRVILMTGTIAELPVRWNQAATDSTTPITATGILRRLAQGQSALRSPIYRQLIAQPAQGYWPLEDGSDAQAASSALTGGRPAGLLNVNLGHDDAPPGASAAALLTAAGGGSRITARIDRPSTTPDGYAAMLYVKLASLPGSGATLMEVLTTGTVVRWVIGMDGVAFTLNGYDADGVLRLTDSALYFVDPTQWVAVQLEAEEVGGGLVDWALIWHQVGATNFWSFSGTILGTADRIVGANVVAPTDNTAVSHLWLGDNDLPFVAATFMQVSTGYSGELAADRVARLCREEGIPVLVGAGTSAPMGPQNAGALLELLRQCEESDQGMLHEQGGQLAYLPRGGRYNRPVAAALDMAAGHIAAPPEPTDDDQTVRNDVTVSRVGGGSARVVDETSVTEVGRYDTSVDVSLASDGLLADHAAWRVHLGTADELRWPVIELDLARNPTLIDRWLTIKPGSPITITSPPSQLLGTPIDLIVEGYTQTLTVFGWHVTLNCSPGAPWTVGVYDDPGTRRDSASSTLGIARDAVQTSWTFSTASRLDVWSTTATPYDVQCGGEVVTVTSMGAVSGSGPYTQTATVARSVNGVVKAQTAGTRIRLARPVVKAL